MITIHPPDHTAIQINEHKQHKNKHTFQDYNINIKKYIWNQIGAELESKLIRGGDSVFNLIKVVHTKLPPKLWEEDVLSKNTQSWVR